MAALQVQHLAIDSLYARDLKGAMFAGHHVLELSSTNCFEEESEPPSDEDHPILASPYTDAEHLLDPRTLPSEHAAFARTLTAMQPLRPDYATAPYERSFNWQAIAIKYIRAHERQAATEFFVIVFRSRLKVGADRHLLGQLDKEAHLEAVRAGGLLKYWFGSPDADRRNLATCIWRAWEDARRGGAGPGHAAAMTAARQMYEEWTVERFRLVIRGTQAVFTQLQN